MTNKSDAPPLANLSVPLHYIGQLSQYLGSNGIDTQTWLAGVGLGEQELLADARLLPLEDYVGLILSAVALAPHPSVGLEMGMRLRVHSHGLLGLAMMNCRTLQQVLDIFCRYLAIRTPLVGLDMRKSGGKVVCAVMERVPIAPIRVYFLEALLATFHQLFAELAGHPKVFTTLVLPYPVPAYPERYRDVFACDIRFGGQRCEVILDSAVLETPVGSPDQQVLTDTLKMCEQQLSQLDQHASYQARVRRVLLSRPEALPNSEQVAKQLNLTKRTLHRYLQKEGSQYQDILDEVKAQLAQHYLGDCGHSVTTCGFLLGYADVANFRRAFRRWFGKPPTDWQKHHRGEQD